MADRRHGERDDFLRQIDQAAGGRGWSNQTQEAASFVDEHVEPEAAERMETIHVYVVRESDLEHPPDDLVVEGELAAPAANLPPREEDHLHPELDDGELTVSMRSEVHTCRMRAYVTAGFAVVLLVATMVFLLTITLLAPPPTVILILSVRDLTASTTFVIVEGKSTGAGHIQGRPLPSLTLTQSGTVPATGKGHQDAQDAVGTITFYNGLFFSQTVAAGTKLTGSDGVQVITDHVAMIPPARASTPPTYGQVTVSAHAIVTGPQGNIPVRDINQACCLASVLAQNAAAFQGGQAERDYPVVTRADTNHVGTNLTAALMRSEQAALTAQLAPGEALVPPTCSRTATANHQPGEEAAAVTVTIAERCTAVAYQSIAVQDDTRRVLTHEATQQLGIHYRFTGLIQMRVLKAALATDQKQGIATLVVRVEGIWVFQFSQDELQQIKRLVGGSTGWQAQLTLLRIPGIEKVTIVGIGEDQRLPRDIASIHLLLLDGAG